MTPDHRVSTVAEPDQVTPPSGADAPLAADGRPRSDESAVRPAPIVDFGRAARRIRTSALVLGSLALAGWLVTGLVGTGPDPAHLGAWGGLALFGMFLVEVVVVGGSALRGMFAAGDRGERLAGGDVGLLPPQLTRRARRRDPDA